MPREWADRQTTSAKSSSFGHFLNSCRYKVLVKSVLRYPRISLQSVPERLVPLAGAKWLKLVLGDFNWPWIIQRCPRWFKVSPGCFNICPGRLKVDPEWFTCVFCDLKMPWVVQRCRGWLKVCPGWLKVCVGWFKCPGCLKVCPGWFKLCTGWFVMCLSGTSL